MVNLTKLERGAFWKALWRSVKIIAYGKRSHKHFWTRRRDGSQCTGCGEVKFGVFL